MSATTLSLPVIYCTFWLKDYNSSTHLASRPIGDLRLVVGFHSYFCSRHITTKFLQSQTIARASTYVIGIVSFCWRELRSLAYSDSSP
ncbi:hypothetical protein CEXT_544681 [Caerostris extrusa]|uniref:Uncharacterized protein n=1 Tax=Caerostris extrusa TaxID=172846 RepID=A0AAV4REQ9_CAEEX|nr:hypothetical protein CEXT_544681 [Caerostris extrusa]